MFDIHPAFSLDRLTAIPPSPATPPMPTNPVPLPPMPGHPYLAPDTHQSSVAQFLWGRTSVKRALQVALTSDIKKPPVTSSKKASIRTRDAGVPAIPRLPPLKFAQYDILGEILSRVDPSDSASVLGKHERTYSAPPVLFQTIISDALNATRHLHNDAVESEPSTISQGHGPGCVFLLFHYWP